VSYKQYHRELLDFYVGNNPDYPIGLLSTALNVGLKRKRNVVIATGNSYQHCDADIYLPKSKHPFEIDWPVAGCNVSVLIVSGGHKKYTVQLLIKLLMDGAEYVCAESAGNSKYWMSKFYEHKDINLLLDILNGKRKRLPRPTDNIRQTFHNEKQQDG